MAREFGGDLYDLSNMTDDEIRDLVIQQLNEYPNIDAGWIDVQVKDGLVTLAGRIGTDNEYRVAEEIVHDVIGIQNYSNELMVDETHRTLLPEAADEANAEEEELDDQLGTPDMDQSDTASHLIEDLEGQTFGTHDMQRAIEGGMPYVPPDHPVGDGYDSTENH